EQRLLRGKIERRRDVNSYLMNTTISLGQKAVFSIYHLVVNCDLLKRFGCFAEGFINVRILYYKMR
ncbi:MAG: hypothetical protein WBJ81_00885, partial [Rickettsiales bacterium]